MGESSIYYYFKSKEDIFEAVVKKEADDLEANLDEILQIVFYGMVKFRSIIYL